MDNNLNNQTTENSEGEEKSPSSYTDPNAGYTEAEPQAKNDNSVPKEAADDNLKQEDYVVGIKLYDIENEQHRDGMYVAQGSRVVPKAAQDHRDDILIIEMGSNGGWDNYDELIAQYQSIIDYTGCEDYIIVGDTDDPGSSLADEGVINMKAEQERIIQTGK